MVIYPPTRRSLYKTISWCKESSLKQDMISKEGNSHIEFATSNKVRVCASKRGCSGAPSYALDSERGDISRHFILKETQEGVHYQSEIESDRLMDSRECGLLY